MTPFEFYGTAGAGILVGFGIGIGTYWFFIRKNKKQMILKRKRNGKLNYGILFNQ